MAPPEPSAPLLSPRDRDLVDRAWAWSRVTSALPAESIHGPTHWRRVARLGLRIARLEGADLLVVALFAGLHDVAREHDGKDLEHGPRAVGMVRRGLGRVLSLGPERWEQLYEAIALHTDGRTSADPTIGACWDADRLDLVRIGFALRRELLSTDAARSDRLVGAADRLWSRDRRFRVEAGLPVWTVQDERSRTGRKPR